MVTVIYTLTIIEYWSYTYLPTKNLHWEFQLNSLLTNSINKYHPFIFYFSLTWVYTSLLLLLQTNKKSQFKSVYAKIWLIQKSSLFLQTIYFTLGLGSWWALQEGSWGGWWNWDSSEVFGLLVMLFYIQLIHRSFTKTILSNVKNSVVSFLITIALTYVLIQLNFDLVSHNFGTKINQFVNSDQFFYIITSLLSAVLVLTVLLYKKYTNNYVFLSKIKPILIKTTLLILVTLCVVLLSFVELINNFYWLIFGTNVMNILNITPYYSSLTLLVLYVILLRNNTLNTPLFFLLTTQTEYLFVLLLSFIKQVPTIMLHALIYLFIFVTYQSLNQSLMSWNMGTCNEHTFITNFIIDNYYFFIKLNTTYIEFASTELVNNQLSDIGWSFMQWGTNLQTHAFQHNVNSGLIFQGLLSSFLEYVHNILVFDHCSQLLGLLVVSLLVKLLNLQLVKPEIVF